MTSGTFWGFSCAHQCSHMHTNNNFMTWLFHNISGCCFWGEREIEVPVQNTIIAIRGSLTHCDWHFGPRVSVENREKTSHFPRTSGGTVVQPCTTKSGLFHWQIGGRCLSPHPQWVPHLESRHWVSVVKLQGLTTWYPGGHELQGWQYASLPPLKVLALHTVLGDSCRPPSSSKPQLGVISRPIVT